MNKSLLKPAWKDRHDSSSHAPGQEPEFSGLHAGLRFHQTSVEGQPFSSSHAPEQEAEFSGLHTGFVESMGYRAGNVKGGEAHA